jgi:molecular chaperone DnaK
MRLGIDFGTTHTVVAAVDRGNHPAVSFDGVDTSPSIVAANAAGELRFGVDAAAVRHEPGCPAPRSFKRLLADAGPQTEANLAGRNHRLADLLTGFLAQLKSDLQRRSNAGLAPGETIEAAISVPSCPVIFRSDASKVRTKSSSAKASNGCTTTACRGMNTSGSSGGCRS